MIVVEVLGRRGEVVQVVRLTSLPATIGRAWSSDLVLSDPTVDAQHARIVDDGAGGLAIQDLGSVNGLRTVSGKGHLPGIALNGATTVRLGRTLLRIARSDLPVPAAVPDLAPSGRLAWLLASPPGMALACVAAIGGQVLALWLGSYEAKAGASIAGQALAIVAGVAVWAGIWSFIGRLRVHQFQFWQHLTLAWLMVLAIALLGPLQGVANALRPQGGVQSLIVLTEGAVVIATLTAHLGLVSMASRGRRIGIASGITVVAIGLLFIGARAVTGESGDTVQIGATLEPLPVGMIRAQSVDDLIREAEALKREVDAAAKQ